MVSCVVISIAFIAYCVMKFGINRVGGVISYGVGLCIVFLLVFLSRFYFLGGGMECVLAHSPSEIGMVTPY